MENLKLQFKLIICIALFFNTFNIAIAKNVEKFENAEKMTNYLSGVLSLNENKYQKSYNYLKKINNLEDIHYNYSQYFQYSLVSLEKFNDAAAYAKKLEKKNLDNFGSNLISGVYHLKNKNLDKSKKYFQKLSKNNQDGVIHSLLSISLNNWMNFKDINDVNMALKNIENIPERFKKIKKIQKTFVYCYFNSIESDIAFKKLIDDPETDYSRYLFFYVNLLNQKNNEKKAKDLLNSSLNSFPRNLMLNQLKHDINKKNFDNNKFDCRDLSHIFAEIFYIVSNALATQENYSASNFYLNLAKYLNPHFVSYDTLLAENFYKINKYDLSRKIYYKIKKKGLVYQWYATKQISSIFLKEKKTKEALQYIEKNYKKIENPNEYQIYDYAEFLKNNDNYKESIKYYSEALEKIDKEHYLYAKITDGRGVAYERTGQWEKAELDLLDSLSAEPEQAYVINYLAYSWIEQGKNIGKSLEMLKKANKLRPNDGFIIDSLGWAMFKQKDYKEAKKYLELAIRIMSADPVVHDHYADALWMNKKTLQARYYWNYVLNLEDAENELKKNIKQKLLFGLGS